ncbi:CBS domain-containing protein [Pseudonocardia sp. C8]|uniref:CBS domain-containing protein n=1 Tax=Pseudonocardia sp. C8 TaxID=2762759 RepID=UPI001642EBEE|nr:CBS domain-containing protein [Pseudonocardia sp. C8]MBC3190967.1 CBS domain-containing protein [Pseudonocardia sp. C8]
MPGKVDWLARNLPVEGTDAGAPIIGRDLRNDAVIAAPNESIADVRARVMASPQSFALVTTADRILLGRLRGSQLDHVDPAAVAAEVMEAGPSTLRPHEPADTVRSHLVGKGLTYAIVTDPDGRLLGTVNTDDLIRSSAGPQEHR